MATGSLRRFGWGTTVLLGLVLGLGLGVLAPAAPATASATVPHIRSFTPTTGPVGTVVIINGTGFTGATVLRFHGVASVFTVLSSSKITATVPDTPSSAARFKVTTPAGTAASASSFTVTPDALLSAATGPPTSTVTVSGNGFAASEGVDIYFDTTDEALAGTNAAGSFGPISITVPASATPGTHWISAEGRHSGLFAQAAFTVSANWAQFRDTSKHQGVNPYENVLSTANVSQIDEDWSFTTGGLVDSSPAVVNGVIYVGSEDGNTYALIASTGTELWSFQTGETSSSPAVVNGVVYVGSGNNVDALDASTGAELWSFNAGVLVDAPPTVVNGMVYIGSENSDILYALDASTGAELWSFTPNGAISGSPAVANGVIYFGSGNGNVYALDASTGAELWSFNTEGDVVSSPAVADGVVYLGCGPGQVCALDASTGAELWNFQTRGTVESSPAVANGVVYLGSDDTFLYALDASTGAELWSFNAGGGFVVSSPALANRVVYVGVGNNVYALDASTGAALWKFPTGGLVESSPAVVNGMVYVGSEDHNLYAFGLAGGLASPPRPQRGSLHPDYGLRQQMYGYRALARIKMSRQAACEGASLPWVQIPPPPPLTCDGVTAGRSRRFV